MVRELLFFLALCSLLKSISDHLSPPDLRLFGRKFLLLQYQLMWKKPIRNVKSRQFGLWLGILESGPLLDVVNVELTTSGLFLLCISVPTGGSWDPFPLASHSTVGKKLDSCPDGLK